MKLDSLKKLYVHELKDLHSAERQILEALPKMIDAATDEGLKKAFRDHLEETRGQVERLDQIFATLEFSAQGHHCKGIEGLLEEGRELIGSDIEPEVLDAGLIAAAQRVEHYEMAGYGVARTYADQLGDHRAAELLQKTLEEEGAADRTLTAIAERHVNFVASVA
jgi:ferritin-like metal-binding protein YciE